MMSAQLAIQKVLAFSARLLAPGYGWCRSCGLPWKFVRHHTFWFTPTSGKMWVCETCFHRHEEDRVTFMVDAQRAWLRSLLDGHTTRPWAP